MKKFHKSWRRISRVVGAVAAIMLLNSQVQAQCLTGNLYPSNIITPTVIDGVTPNEIALCNYAGEYAMVNVTSGQTYKFLSDSINDFITISTNNGTSAAAFGTQPLTWVSTVTGTIYVYFHANSSCATFSDCRATWVIAGTPPSCLPPSGASGLAASNITATGATLNWQASGTASIVGYEYYYSTTNTAPTSTTAAMGTTAAGVTSAPISALSPSTTYYAWYRTACSSTTKSPWTSYHTTFTTACATTNTPYSESFSGPNFMPNCWDWKNGQLANPTVFTSGGWSPFYSSNYGNSSTWPATNPSAVVNLYYGNPMSTWMISPSINLGTTPKQLEFDLALTAYNSNQTASISTGQRYVLLISTDNGVTWTSANTMQEWNSSSTLTPAGTHYTYNLSTYTGAVKFAFYAETLNGLTAGDVEVYMDNFQVGDLSSCNSASGVNITNLVYNAATVNWSASSSPTVAGYDWEVRTSGTPGSGATGLVASGTVSGTTYSTNVTGLMGSTAYTAYVKTNCSATSSSNWSAGAAFTTPCNPVGTPFTENFTGSTFEPTCWTHAQGTLASPSVINTSTWNQWSRSNFAGANLPIGNGSAKMSLWGGAATGWLITPSIDLGTTPKQLDFDVALTANYATNAAVIGSDQKFALLISTDNGITWTAANAIKTWTSLDTVHNGSGNHYTFNLASYSNVVKFAFYGESTGSASSSIDFFVDNVNIGPVLTCNNLPSNLVSSAISATGATIGWTAPTTAPTGGYEYYYSTSSTAPTATTAASGTTAAGTNSAMLGTLSPSTTYYYWVRSACSSTDKSIWIGPATFATPCLPTTTPFAEDFLTSSFPPPCWMTARGTLGTTTVLSSGAQWNYRQFGNASVNPVVNGSARINIYGSDRSGWLITPSIDLGTTTPKVLKFKLALAEYYTANPGSIGSDQKFAVVISPDNGNTWSSTNTLQTWGSTTPISVTGDSVTISLGAYSGIVRIGFYGEALGVASNDVDLFVDSIRIVNAACTPPVVHLGADTTICAGATLSLNAGAANAGLAKLWSTSDTSQIITVTAAGTYSVAVTGGPNCVGHDTIVVAVAPNPTVALGNDTAICNGGPYVLDAGAGGTYMWNTGATTQTLSATTSGTYSVTVTNAAGCSSMDTIMLTIGTMPTAGGITSTGTSPTFAFQVNSPMNVTTYAWDFGDGNTSSAQNPSHTYTMTGTTQTYTVTLVITNECGSTSFTTTVIVAANGINTLQLDAKALKLYPNPTAHTVTLENESRFKMKNVVITNILGQRVIATPITNNNKQSIDVSHLTSGLYNVTIEFEEGTVTRKLEILK